MKDNLKDGWHNGEGKAIDPFCFGLVKKVIQLSDEWFTPHIYPILGTHEGGIQFEWDVELEDCKEYHELEFRPGKSVRYWWFMETPESKESDELDCDMTWQNPSVSVIVNTLDYYHV